MAYALRTRTLFKCLVFMYLLTMCVIMVKLHYDQTFNQNLMVEKFKEHHDTHKHNITTEKTKIVEVVKNVTKIVYVNRTVIQHQVEILSRFGPGENGSVVDIKYASISEETLNRTKAYRNKHGFDTIVSDIISLHRKLPDARPRACKSIKYPDNLPQISIVIIFRDEWPSILLRTVYSVLETPPTHLVKEIVLVDDGSINEDLRIQVDLHVASVEKLTLVRHKVSLGLMLARESGIEATTADYFAVMDGHMEVTPGWLEPLIYRLTQEPNALLCSHVGQINQDTFAFNVDKEKEEEYVFDEQFPFFDPLTLDQVWAVFRKEFRAERNHSVEPIEYGTVQGMMAVMRKEFFMQLGGFDTGMKIWGAEQEELSIKVWLCGGRIEMLPCSKVGHMYRITPWGKVKSATDYYARNKRRVAEVWMDEPYRGYIVDTLRNMNYNHGYLGDRHRIRQNNNCKPYIYYLDKVREFSDIFAPFNLKQNGVIYNKASEKCIDIMYLNVTQTHKLGSYQCHGNMNQYFVFTENSQIRAPGNFILNVTRQNDTKLVIDIVKTCMNIYDASSYWRYDTGGMIIHTATGLCLSIMKDLNIDLYECNGSLGQMWEWGRLVHNETNRRDKVL